jgi:hypothetical protein
MLKTLKTHLLCRTEAAKRLRTFATRVLCVDEAHARKVASDFLAQRCEEFRCGNWVLTVAEDHDTAWAVVYQAIAFVESGNVLDCLVGNGPVVVPKSGAQPWMAWSGLPVGEQIARGRAGYA